MKESYRENLASSSGHEPYAGSRNAPGVAWASGDAGQPLSSEIHVPVCRPCTDKGKATLSSAPRQGEGKWGQAARIHIRSKIPTNQPGDPTNHRLIPSSPLRPTRSGEVGNPLNVEYRTSNIEHRTSNIEHQLKSGRPLALALSNRCSSHLLIHRLRRNIAAVRAQPRAAA